MKHTSIAVAASALILSLSACASVGGFLDEMAERERQQWEPQVTPTELSYSLPRVSPHEANRQIQSEGRVTISVATPSFEARTIQRASFEPLSSPTSVAEQRIFMKTETPAVEISPRNLTFNVKINNQHERVLRLDGTIVRVNVNGQIMTLGQEHYRDFLQGLVLPRQEAEFTIGGPAVDQIPDGAVVGLMLYDVVTQTNAAGQPTERQNFEWFFVHRSEPHTRGAETVVQRVRMARPEALSVGAPWPTAPAGGS